MNEVGPQVYRKAVSVARWAIIAGTVGVLAIGIRVVARVAQGACDE